MPVTQETADIFRENVRILMRRRKWTQDELGKRAGISQSHVGNVLRKTYRPTTEIMGKIADAFGLPVWQLLIPNLPPHILDSAELPSVIATYLAHRRDPQLT